MCLIGTWQYLQWTAACVWWGLLAADRQLWVKLQSQPDSSPWLSLPCTDSVTGLIPCCAGWGCKSSKNHPRFSCCSWTKSMCEEGHKVLELEWSERQAVEEMSLERPSPHGSKLLAQIKLSHVTSLSVSPWLRAMPTSCVSAQLLPGCPIRTHCIMKCHTT